MVGCGQTSATWLPSTMRLPPSTRPSGSRGRRSSVFVPERRVYMSNTSTPTVFYRTLNIEGLEIFYREAGPRDAPTVLLLHGFPSSSHMFRNLIPLLADKYHVVAPDQAYQDRPGNKEIQLSILYNAKRNLDVYADWQEYFRK